MDNNVLFLDEERAKKVLYSPEAQNYWRVGMYNGEEMVILEAFESDKLEAILRKEFPTYIANNIIADVLKEVGLNSDYGFSDQYTFCSNCNNIIGTSGIYPPDDYFVGEGEIGCPECIETHMPELVALHEVINIPYREMKKDSDDFHNLSVFNIDDEEKSKYAVGTEDEAEYAFEDITDEFLDPNIDVEEKILNAINNKDRGFFLSTYDKKEIVHKVDDVFFFIYRLD